MMRGEWSLERGTSREAGSTKEHCISIIVSLFMVNGWVRLSLLDEKSRLMDLFLAKRAGKFWTRFET